MIDPKLSHLVNEAAEAAARRIREVNLDGLWQRFIRAATSPVFFGRLQAAYRWAGAIPTYEYPGDVFTTHAKPLNVIGIDGSQIYPNDKSSIIWAYVQAVAYCSGTSPELKSLFVDIGTLLQHGDLKENQEELVALTNAWRTLIEMRQANETSIKKPGSLVILDNSLLPWLSVSGQIAQLQLQEYLDHYKAIEPGSVAGIISGPQSRLFEKVVHLAEAETADEGLIDKYEFLDQSLMLHILMPGQRSALFLHGSPRNLIFRQAGAGVYFFFLRTAQNELQRVEIPEWVADNPDLVDQVQASILADASVHGYSYVLSQAHQHATIPMDITNLLRSSAEAWYIQATGRLEYHSAKSIMKNRG